MNKCNFSCWGFFLGGGGCDLQNRCGMGVGVTLNGRRTGMGVVFTETGWDSLFIYLFIYFNTIRDWYVTRVFRWESLTPL